MDKNQTYMRKGNPYASGEYVRSRENRRSLRDGASYRMPEPKPGDRGQDPLLRGRVGQPEQHRSERRAHHILRLRREQLTLDQPQVRGQRDMEEQQRQHRAHAERGQREDPRPEVDCAPKLGRLK